MKHTTLRLVPLTRRDEIAETLRRNFPFTDEAVFNEYLDALESYELFSTAKSLDRLITATQMLATPPTIQLEP